MKGETVPSVQTRNLIAGEWVSASDGAEFPVINPATDSIVARVPSSGARETEAAIAAASKALAFWKSRTAGDRGELLRSLASLMRRDCDSLAALMTAEQGKPLAEARTEIVSAASYLDWAAEEGRRVYGEIVPASSSSKRILVMRQPVGVAAIITPWNFPAAMITRKLGPALAAGCTVVIKPAEDTPLSALAIGALAIEAGFPPGVINIVTGEPPVIGSVLLADERVRKLSFTGSTEVGRLLMSMASRNLLRLSMELGGHAPFIVFDDADLKRAVEAAVACKFRNAGQTCICANRFFVQAGIYKEFIAAFGAAISALKLGAGTEPGVQIGPLINDQAVQKVQEHVDDAAGKGGRVSVGGKRVRISGLADRFFAPTLIEGLNPGMRISREETFGPVAPVSRFETEEEAVTLANDSEFGLAAYFYTQNASRLMRVAEALEYGIVGANDAAPSTAQAPFGGVKHSGFGREGGRQVMEEYTEVKYVSWGL